MLPLFCVPVTLSETSILLLPLRSSIFILYTFIVEINRTYIGYSKRNKSLILHSAHLRYFSLKCLICDSWYIARGRVCALWVK